MFFHPVEFFAVKYQSLRLVFLLAVGFRRNCYLKIDAKDIQYFFGSVKYYYLIKNKK
jgi:hypothetical protein